MPVHSPLLKQSLLLAFPPLSDMLKFGGSFHVHQVTSLVRERQRERERERVIVTHNGVAWSPYRPMWGPVRLDSRCGTGPVSCDTTPTALGVGCCCSCFSPRLVHPSRIASFHERRSWGPNSSNGAPTTANSVRGGGHRRPQAREMMSLHTTTQPFLSPCFVCAGLVLCFGPFVLVFGSSFPLLGAAWGKGPAPHPLAAAGVPQQQQ